MRIWKKVNRRTFIYMVFMKMWRKINSSKGMNLLTYIFLKVVYEDIEEDKQKNTNEIVY